MQFVPEYFMTQKIFSCIFFYITDQYKIQEICNGITYDDPFPIKYVPDQ